MSVSGISPSVNTATTKTETAKATAAVEPETTAKKAEAKTEQTKKKDSFVKSEPREEIGYSNIKKGLSTEQVKELNDQRLEGLKNMVQKLISGQAKAGQGFSFESLNINVSVDISMSKIEAASKSSNIFDDPTFGVDAMASRLMDMAISLSGGDSSKADVLMSAVEKGFSDATAAWGDELPDVCQATLKEVRNRFDYWKENGSLDGYTYAGYDVADE